MNVSSISEKIRSFASAAYRCLPLQPALTALRQFATRIFSPEFWTKRTVILAAAGSALLLYGAAKVVSIALKRWDNRGAPENTPTPPTQVTTEHKKDPSAQDCNDTPAKPASSENPPAISTVAEESPPNANRQEENAPTEAKTQDTPSAQDPDANTQEENGPTEAETSDSFSDTALSESSSRSSSPTSGSSPLKSSGDEEMPRPSMNASLLCSQFRHWANTDASEDIRILQAEAFRGFLKQWKDEYESWSKEQDEEEQLATLDEIESSTKDLAYRILEIIKDLDSPTLKSSIVEEANNLLASIAEKRKRLIPLPSAAPGLFTNPDHEWKQKRYEVALGSLRSAFEKESQTTVENLIETLEKSQSSSQLKRPLVEFLKEWSGPVQENDFRTRYYRLLYQLRELCRSSLNEQSEEAQIIQRLAYVRYAKVEIYSFMKEIVELWMGRGEKLPSELTDAHIERIAKADPNLGAMRAAVEIGKLRGTLGCGFDPNMQSNVPFVLADLPLSKTVRFLRMGCPTVQGLLWGTDVAPEFKAYLAHLKANGKQHLYVSLQSGVPRWLGDESARTFAIKSLAEEFRGTFVLAVLDQDLSFYKQSKPGIVEFEAFKKEFESALFGELHVTGFHFPAEWIANPAFKERLLSLIDDVHQLIFDGKESLDQHERQDLIEIYYAFLVPYLADYGKVDHANCTCKDAIDRAMKTNGLILTLTQIMTGKAGDTTVDEEIKNLTLYPSISVKKQPIIHSRRERLIAALTRLRNSDVQARIAAYASENIGINRNGTISVLTV